MGRGNSKSRCLIFLNVTLPGSQIARLRHGASDNLCVLVEIMYISSCIMMFWFYNKESFQYICSAVHSAALIPIPAPWYSTENRCPTKQAAGTARHSHTQLLQANWDQMSSQVPSDRAMYSNIPLLRDCWEQMPYRARISTTIEWLSKPNIICEVY